MENKQVFTIPKNFKTSFEFIPNLGFKDVLIFIPSIITDIIIIQFVPITGYIKLFLCLLLMFIPFCLVFIRPVKNSIPAWKHIMWAIQFEKKQKTFYYRKVRSSYEEETKEIPRKIK